MFTGLIETTGRLQARQPRGDGQRLTIEHSPFDDSVLSLGESIAVAGVCLTVAGVGPGWFAADVSPETLQRSTLGGLPAGSRVNLERALRLNDRLGGHLVTGHADGMGAVVAVDERGENRGLSIRLAPELAQYVAHKGSVTVDGVSLTVNHAGSESFGVNLVPHTLAATALADLRPGDRVNLEVDLIARYLARLMQSRHEQN